jgi:hypothetical protein
VFLNTSHERFEDVVVVMVVVVVERERKGKGREGGEKREDRVKMLQLPDRCFLWEHE